MTHAFSKTNASFRFVGILLSVATLLWLCACGENNNPTPATTTYKVAFNSNGGTVVDSQTVNSGSKATKPSDPTRAGYTFAGWYKDTTFSTAFNFDTENITASLTLYAKWTQNLVAYKVAFNSKGGTAVDSQMVNSGSKATKPTDPIKAGYILVGWYKDTTSSTAFNFSTETITADMTLYAKWEVFGVTSYVLPTSGIGGLTENVSADIDDIARTITVGINIAVGQEVALNTTLQPVIMGALGVSQSAVITNYYRADARGLIKSVGTYTLTRADGKTKSYDVRVVYGAVVIKGGFEGVNSPIDHYEVETYVGDNFVNTATGGASPRYSLTKTESVKSLPYIYSDYITAGTTFFMIITAKSSAGTTLATGYFGTYFLKIEVGAKTVVNVSASTSTVFSQVSIVGDADKLLVMNVDGTGLTTQQWGLLADIYDAQNMAVMGKVDNTNRTNFQPVIIRNRNLIQDKPKYCLGLMFMGRTRFQFMYLSLPLRIGYNDANSKIFTLDASLPLEKITFTLN